MKTHLVSLLMLAVAGAVVAANGQSPVGTAFTYQGVLSESGVPLHGIDLADIEANLYDAAVGGNQVGSAVIVYNVDFEQGRFTILLDFGASPFAGNARWLALMVRKPPGSGQWVLLSPRQPLTTVPYALYALDGACLWSENGSNIYYNAGNVGIGTASPAYKLDVSGTLRAAGTGANGAPNLIIHDSNGGSDRPGIQFTNNSMHYIAGDDASEESFGFYSVCGNNRSYAAKLSVYGPAVSSWGKSISLTHNGTDGIVTTDTGSIALLPAVAEDVLLVPNTGVGKVGIGTWTPKQALHVAGAYYGKGSLWLYAYQGDGQSGTAYVQARDDSGTSSIGLQLRAQNAGANLDVMRLEPDGDVGIGLTTADDRLDVYKQATPADDAYGVASVAPLGGYFSTNYQPPPPWTPNQGPVNTHVQLAGPWEGNDGGWTGFGVWAEATGVAGIFTSERIGIQATGDGQYGGVFDGPDNDGTYAGVKIISGSQAMLIDGNEIDSSSGMYLQNNSNHNVYMVMGGGSVGMGTESSTYRLNLPNTNNNNGKAIAYAWLTFSAARFKENVEPLEDALDMVARLRGVSYDWKTELGGGRSVGFIAEEVAEVLPSAVEVDASGEVQGMDYTRVIPVAVEAIKQLKTENDDLKARVARLEILVEQCAVRAGR